VGGQFLFQLGASTSRGGLPRQLDDKPQPVLAIPQLCIRGQPVPVQMQISLHRYDQSTGSTNFYCSSSVDNQLPIIEDREIAPSVYEMGSREYDVCGNN